MKELKFRILGKVKAKQSVKFGRNGIKYTPKDMIAYSNLVKLSFQKEYPDHLPHILNDVPLKVTIDVYFTVPKSFPKRKKELALQGKIRPTVKPDWDNIAKNICDALNGITYPDDKAIVSGFVNKYYSEYDYVNVTIGACNE